MNALGFILFVTVKQVNSDDTSFHLDKITGDQYIPPRQYGGDVMKEFIKVMKALSDQNRVKLLKMLQKRMMCVCEIQAALGIAQPTVSKHLKILEDAGLVCREKEGLWVNYSLSDGGRSPYAASLLGNLKHWLADDPGTCDLLEKSDAIRREDLCRTREKYLIKK
jgi:ArsR family transcriptional regulator